MRAWARPGFHDSCAFDVEAAVAAAWRRFYAGPGKKEHRKLKLRWKRSDMNRTILPAIIFHCAWWPARLPDIKAIASLERDMLSLIMQI